jgi:hypothetical protein
MKKLFLIFLVFFTTQSFCQDLEIENDLREEEFWDSKIKSLGLKSLEIRSYDANESMDSKGTPYRLYIYNSAGKKETSYYFNPDSSIRYQMTYFYDKENAVHKIKIHYKDSLVKVTNIKLNESGLLSSYLIVHPQEGHSSVKYEYTTEGHMKKVHLRIINHYMNYSGKYRGSRSFGYVPARDAGTKIDPMDFEFIYFKEDSINFKGSLPYAENKESMVCQLDNSGNIIKRKTFINGKNIDCQVISYNDKGLPVKNILNVNDVPVKKFKFNYN